MAETYIAELGYRVDTRPLKRGETALDNLTKAGVKTEQGIDRISSSVGILSAGIAALAANSVINDVIKYSDSWTLVNNKLRVVIDSEEQLIAKRKELITLSKETNANLDSTVALYSELYRSTRQLGTAEEDVMNVTRTLNNLFVSGGKDAQTQAGAIRQLSQALGAGALRGDEFNSVAEAAPRILDALSTQLGISKGELRDFAATGGITAEILVNAINSYSTEAQRLADVTGQTFEQAIQNANTNVTAFVGNAKSLTDATKAIGSAIEGASENIGAIVNGVSAAASVMLLSAVPASVKYTASVLANVKAQLLANTQSIRTVSALGQVTVATGSATVATNALGIATKFLLGPWGLLLGAVSAAGIAYALTDEKATDYNNTLDTQKGLLDDVTKRVKMLSEFQKADVALNAQFKLNDLIKERVSLEQQILSDSFDPNAIMNLTVKKQERLVALKAEEARLNAIIKAANEKPTEDKPATDMVDSSQLQALKNMQKEIGMSADQLFLFRQEQKSIANGDAPEMTAAIVAQAQAIIDQRKAAEESKAAFKDLFGTDTVDTFALQQSKDYDAWLESISTTTTEIQRLQEEIAKAEEAMAMGDLDMDIGREYIDNLNAQIRSLDTSPFDAITSSTKDGLASIQGLSAQGSKEYKKLGIAIEAVNAIQAVSAVLNQAAGDPYTAFARMAAMAASVASLGYSVGSMSGDFTDEAAQNQATQGTTVWGDKSESIANGIDIIASATDKLVGINTNMLKALTSVQNGIAKAAALIGRDIDMPEINQDKLTFTYSDVMPIFEPLGIEKLIMDPLGLFGKTFDKLLGGSSKVTDEGIRILGGELGDMIDNITVQSFQAVKYKKWKFGSTKRKTQYQDITSEVGSQFQLILDSIADSVFAGASMLGFSDSQLSEAIQNFEIATIDISLKDLSAEEQQAEIEAVFSSIFDDLAGSVIPFLDEFQMVGEGLGETLARVATQVNIMDLMVEQLGVTMFDKFSDPQLYAEAAASISDLVGGVESLAEKTGSFIDTFAPDETKLDIYSKSLEDSLNAVGLQVPDTAEGFWDLMNGLDASTKAGREQIAALLNAQGVADEYYSLIESEAEKAKEEEEARASAAAGYRSAITGMYDITEELARINLEQALNAARRGDLSLAEDLNLSSVSPDLDNYSSRVEYELARADAAAKLEELAKITEGTISVDQKQLETLEQIRNGIDEMNGKGQSDSAKVLAVEVSSFREMQKQQGRINADSNALLQQMISDGIPVRIES